MNLRRLIELEGEKSYDNKRKRKSLEVVNNAQKSREDLQRNIRKHRKKLLLPNQNQNPLFIE